MMSREFYVLVLVSFVVSVLHHVCLDLRKLPISSPFGAKACIDAKTSTVK